MLLVNACEYPAMDIKMRADESLYSHRLFGKIHPKKDIAFYNFISLFHRSVSEEQFCPWTEQINITDKFKSKLRSRKLEKYNEYIQYV